MAFPARSRLAPLALLLLVSAGAALAQVPETGAPTFQLVRLQAGTGKAIAQGQTALVQYTGWVYDASAPGHRGRQFDSSIPRGSPFSFRVGDHMVIPGWDQGVLGMKVGEKRELILPPAWGYGALGSGDRIAPNTSLIFEVELVGIQ